MFFKIDAKRTSHHCCETLNFNVIFFSDDLVAWCVYMIRDIVDLVLGILTEHPWIWQIGVVGFGLVAITSVIAVVKAGKSTTDVKPTSDYESEESEDEPPQTKPPKRQSKKTK